MRIVTMTPGCEMQPEGQLGASPEIWPAENRRISSALEWMLSLRYTRVRWNSTVRGLRKSAAPISRFDLPSAAWMAI